MELKVQNNGNEVSHLSLKTLQSENEGLLADAIPEDLLFSLTTMHERPLNQTLCSVKRLKTPKELQLVVKKGTPDNAWHHKGRQIQYKHLTEFPKGNGKNFGTRDVSFLYDIARLETPSAPKLNALDKSASRYDQLSKTSFRRSSLAIPETIIPEEYHLVKSNAVVALEQQVNNVTSALVDQEQNLRIFPSLKPTKRFEVVQLSRTMDLMLDRIGLNDLQNEIKGPTQIHNLLELIKKEQQIYDTVFHEVIRQVTVDCVDRGKLLSKLRQRYADIISRVPQQIESLHSEVMAQRSLDRRLTEELLRFKQSIGHLTSELSTVKEHDKHITKQAEEAQIDLAEALKESHTNASLVNEYHELYELQRHRLEQQIINLTEERELWSNAAYSLCLKVMQNNFLTTAKRLHVTKKAWAKLAGHLSVKLGDRDTEDLVTLQKHVHNWREQMFHVHQVLASEDKLTSNVLCQVEKDITRMLQLFKDELLIRNGSDDVGSMKVPSAVQIDDIILIALKQWEEAISGNAERFGGDNYLLNQERISDTQALVDAWTDVALEIYNRHRSSDGERYELQDVMLSNNNLISQLNKQLSVRIMGENGLIKGLITLQNVIENWISKITLSLKGAEVLSSADWMRFYDDVGVMLSNITDIKTIVGTQQKEEDRNKNLPHVQLHIQDVIQLVQAWLKNSVNGIDAEDGKLSMQVNQVHSAMTYWVVLVLLHLAPDIEEQGAAPESTIGMSCTLDELTDKCKDLAENVSMLTQYLSQCVLSVVEASMQAKREFDELQADHEYRDFLRFKVECKEWIHTCELLVNSLHVEPVKILSDNISARIRENKTLQVKKLSDDTRQQDKDIREQSKIMTENKTQEEVTKEVMDQKNVKKNAQKIAQKNAQKKLQKKAGTNQETRPQLHGNQVADTPTLSNDKTDEMEDITAPVSSQPENMEVIGADENVTSSQLVDNSNFSKDNLLAPSSVLTKSAYDAIASMDKLQEQLLETEERAQNAESVTMELRDKLNAAQEQIRALQKQLAEITEDSNTPDTNKETPPAVSPILAKENKDKPTKPSSPSEQTRKTSSRGSPSGKRTKSKKK